MDDIQKFLKKMDFEQILFFYRICIESKNDKMCSLIEDFLKENYYVRLSFNLANINKCHEFVEKFSYVDKIQMVKSIVAINIAYNVVDEIYNKVLLGINSIEELEEFFKSKLEYEKSRYSSEYFS